jgi:hypothetical protein
VTPTEQEIVSGERTRGYHEIWVDGIPWREDDSAAEEPDRLHGERYLPRKFKIGLGIPEDNTIDVLTNDLAIVALFDGDQPACIGFEAAMDRIANRSWKGGHGAHDIAASGERRQERRLAPLLAFGGAVAVVALIDPMKLEQRITRVVEGCRRVGEIACNVTAQLAATLYMSQGLFDVVEQVGLRFEPGREAHQRIADAEFGPRLGLEPRMRRCCRVGDEALRVAEIV